MNKTNENLKAAFAGESQARNKYAFFAKAARKEGYSFIGKIFEETMENEMQHAKDEFKLLGGIGNTAANLKEAIEGENYETTKMYPEFAKTARKEGNKKAAILFELIGKIEAIHRDRYQKLLDHLQNGTLFSREEPIRWVCEKCGHVHTGKKPPLRCPTCDHPQDYFIPGDI